MLHKIRISQANQILRGCDFRGLTAPNVSGEHCSCHTNHSICRNLRKQSKVLIREGQNGTLNSSRETQRKKKELFWKSEDWKEL
jgi:hypothetical protein